MAFAQNGAAVLGVNHWRVRRLKIGVRGKDENQIFSHAQGALMKESLHYNPNTGNITWIKTRGKAIIGNIAGTKHKHGYIQVNFMGKSYLAHRIAWFLMTDEWPVNDIDHKNGKKNDNRWVNLREATKKTNMENIHRPRCKNPSGYLGVSRSRSKWQARIQTNRKQIWLGSFESPEDAHNAYIRAKQRLHGGYILNVQ